MPAMCQCSSYTLDAIHKVKSVYFDARMQAYVCVSEFCCCCKEEIANQHVNSVVIDITYHKS